MGQAHYQIADIIPISGLTRRSSSLIAAHCLSGERRGKPLSPTGHFGAGPSPPLPGPNFFQPRFIPASHRRSRIGFVVRPTPCNGRFVVGVWPRVWASMTGADGSLVRLSGHLGAWMLGRRKVGFMRGRGFALGLLSKGRWFTPPAFVASGYGLFDLHAGCGNVKHRLHRIERSAPNEHHFPSPA